MILRSLKYSEHEGTPKTWSIDKFDLGQINLIVGRNATGKTRTLNVINGIANLVSGDRKLVFVNGNYEVSFKDNNDLIEYNLQYEQSKVIKEQYIFNGDMLLDRGRGGTGKIKAYKLNRIMEFQTPDNELACVTRRDSVQHPYFDSLYQWGKNCRHYLFGTQLGKDHLAVFGKEDVESLNLKEVDKVVAIFRGGHRKHQNEFVISIQNGMEALGYKCEDIGIAHPPGLKGPIPGVIGMYVKEVDLQFKTYQHEMSQGMFRALSLITQIVYAKMSGTPSCVLIDDIGEGLDYERSTSLINYLITENRDVPLQLIMTTNDRFVMNNVPLEHWCVLQRKQGKCSIYNYQNSKNKFDEFKFTGLVNFDFLTSDFYLKGFEQE